MYAFVSGFFDAGNGITCTGQADFEQDTTASAQKAIKLRGARTLRHRFNNPRPSRASQGYAAMVG